MRLSERATPPQLCTALGVLLLAAAPALACTCIWGGYFSTVARDAQVIVHGTVVAHEGYGMDVAIETVLRGSETREVVRVWGDDGGLCRPYVNRFPVGSEWVLALTHPHVPRNDEQARDYSVGNCGEFFLPVTGGTVYLQARLARISVAALTAEVRAWRDEPPIAAPDLTNLRGIPPILRERLQPNVGAALLAGQERDVERARAAALRAASGLPIVIDAQTCAAVERAGFAEVHIDVAELLAAGSFSPPHAGEAGLTPSELDTAYAGLPALCRVLGTLRPGRADAASFELWMPAAGWTTGFASTAHDRALLGTSTPLSSAADAASLRNGIAFLAVGNAREDIAATAETRFAPRFVAELARFLVTGRSPVVAGVVPVSATPTAVTTTLPAGPGRIEGFVLRSGRPAAPVAIRLLLGQQAWSVWATTDAAGRYSIEVPYGEYELWGCQISTTGDSNPLAGAVTISAAWAFGGEPVPVEQATPVKGPDFPFVEPVVLLSPRGDVSAALARRLVWDAYPGATSYRVVLFDPPLGETADLGLRLEREYETPRNELDLEQAGLTLKPGVHVLEILALDARGTIVSRTRSDQATFRIIE